MGKHGHCASKHTNGLWKFNNSNAVLALVVDDFGVKSNLEQEASYLINSLQGKHATDIKSHNLPKSVII